MQIKFVQKHIVRGETRAEDIVYEVGQVADFGDDKVENTYALAYIDRGFAVEHDEKKAAAEARAEAKARAESDAKAKAEADQKAKDDAKAKADADAKAKGSNPT